MSSSQSNEYQLNPWHVRNFKKRYFKQCKYTGTWTSLACRLKCIYFNLFCVCVCVFCICWIYPSPVLLWCPGGFIFRGSSHERGSRGSAGREPAAGSGRRPHEPESHRPGPRLLARTHPVLGPSQPTSRLLSPACECDCIAMCVHTYTFSLCCYDWLQLLATVGMIGCNFQPLLLAPLLSPPGAEVLGRMSCQQREDGGWAGHDAEPPERHTEVRDWELPSTSKSTSHVGPSKWVTAVMGILYFHNLFLSLPFVGCAFFLTPLGWSGSYIYPSMTSWGGHL